MLEEGGGCPPLRHGSPTDACAAMLELFRGQPDSPERAREISALLSNQHHALDAKIRIRSDDIRRVSELGEVA